jgi:transposase
MPESRRRTRRRWGVEFKRQVVSEASAPGVSVAAVARRYDLNANLVFNWRRRYGGGGVFLPVAISEPARPAPGVGERASERVAGEIEVALPSGHRVQIRGGFDPELVTRLLRGLSS